MSQTIEALAAARIEQEFPHINMLRREGKHQPCTDPLLKPQFVVPDSSRKKEEASRGIAQRGYEYRLVEDLGRDMKRMMYYFHFG